MLSPALAAMQSALSPLLIAGAIVVIVAVLTFYWLGLRSGRPIRRDSSQDDTPQGDSDFAPVTEQAANHNQATAALPNTAVPELAADLLLVDDSAVARAKLRRLFATAGYEVQLARDGVEALALLQKGRYRLMITDLEMPNLDGVELICTCQAQAHTASMPILAITGHDDLQARLNDCQEICGIYRKPWIDEDLTSHVALLLGKQHTRQAEPAES